ncbi:MAG TPA: polysaccharide biosynthesis tyrosine autokinase [Candidatus Acidoferrales bacterium]|nr:polysaccharide biosynthesis tyrosine autokinase [Candidatus Acidoferrales bacterium]
MYFGPSLRGAQPQLTSGFPVTPQEPAGDPDLGSILGTLIRRKRLFAAIFFGFLSLVVLWTLVVPKTYTATIKFIAGASTANTVAPGDTTLPVLNALMAANGVMTNETYVDLIQEDPIVKQVIQNLNLKTDVPSLLDHVNVTPVTNSSIIELDVSWRDPQMAAKIANEFGNVFVNSERGLIAGQAESALAYLSQAMPQAETAMRDADDGLTRFQATHPNVFVGPDGATQGDSAVSAAEQKYAQVQVDQQQAEAQLASNTSQMGAMSPTITGSSNIVQNPVVGQLQAQLAQVNVQLDAARKQYTEQYPGVQALEEQQSQLQKEIGQQSATVVSGNVVEPNPVYQQLNQQAAALRSQIAGDQSQMRALDAELGQSNGLNGSLPAQTVALANLQRKAKMAEDVYSALEQKYSQATVAKTTALSDVAVTQPANPADVAVKPNWRINLILGVVLGLVMAISGVFIIDFLDSTFKDEDDVSRVLPLPLLTSVPQLTSASSKKLPWLRALTVESFLQLVTALRYSSDKPLKTLAITSPHQGDGKTTVAMSTAIAMAELEPKVLLIDADLRRPNVHQRLGLEQSPGLSDVLVGEVSLNDAIQHTKYDGLDLLSSGTSVPNPMKLLQSAKLDAILGDLRKTYRAIIFDTPALLPVHDATVIGTKADATVLVVSARITDAPSTKKALQKLSAIPGVNMIGVVLNRVTPANGYHTYYLTEQPTTPLPHENGVTSQ